MAREAAYWIEFCEAIKQGKARKIPEYDAIEVLSPILILVNWRKKCQVVFEGKIVKGYWREDWGLVVYKPGEVLHRQWREASEWEVEEWEILSDEELKEKGVLRKDGAFSVRIVEKVVDLPAAIRQMGRHIPAERIAMVRKEFILAGDAQLLALYAARLSGFLQSFLERRKPSPELIETASPELGRISQLLEKSETALKRKAQREISLALQGKLWEIPAKIGRAIADLLEQRAKDYQIAMKAIETAEKWYELTLKIERKFRSCYNRLGQLGKKLQESLVSGAAIQPRDLLSIANEAHGIWKYLEENTPKFNPYYSLLQAPEFQRLSRIKSHAEEGKAETVLNDIREAAAKLETVAIGERVTGAELQETQGQLLKG